MSRWTYEPMSDRFWAKVDRTETCWEWVGYRHPKGYGLFYVSPDRRSARAHRVAYELLVGAIPFGLVIDHLCQNRGCVNPAHMEAVTAATNTSRGIRSMQATCQRGHPLSGDNLGRHSKSGARVCKQCSREYRSQWAREKRGVSPRGWITEEKAASIRQARTTHGWSYERLGAEFGVSIASVHKIVQGRWRPKR